MVMRDQIRQFATLVTEIIIIVRLTCQFSVLPQNSIRNYPRTLSTHQLYIAHMSVFCLVGRDKNNCHWALSKRQIAVGLHDSI